MHARKNVLLTVADQLQAAFMSALCSGIQRTPNLDWLCQESMIVRAHVTDTMSYGPAGGSPLIGLYPMNHRAVQNTVSPDARRTRSWKAARMTLGAPPTGRGCCRSWIGKLPS
ncbi:hypothetical protein [Falsiroseomonas sp. E2-1-a20]|uniref:hypothetical protein n=1 Tax=Falsiroseomonas sp. E2-1-a20 TaxID=3239300 RepID=UPI003F3327C6